MTEWGRCQRPDCRGGAARAPWFSCPDPEGDCPTSAGGGGGGGGEPLTFPPEWTRRVAAVLVAPEGTP